MNQQTRVDHIKAQADEIVKNREKIQDQLDKINKHEAQIVNDNTEIMKGLHKAEIAHNRKVIDKREQDIDQAKRKIKEINRQRAATASDVQTQNAIDAEIKARNGITDCAVGVEEVSVADNGDVEEEGAFATIEPRPLPEDLLDTEKTPTE